MKVEQRQAWRMAWISIFVLLLLTLFLYQQTVLYLMDLWNQLETGNYAHGYLVLAISVYLIVRNRRRLVSLLPCPSYLALPAVLAASLLWLLAVLVDVNVVQTVSLLLLLLAIVWAVLGNQVARKLVFPVLFIGFAIPIWFPLSPLLQDLTANVVYWIIRLMEVPALRQENMILLPAGNLAIEEECSGLRYLLAALILGTLYAYLNYQSLRARIVVVIISAATAILANFMRVFIVVYLGYATDMQHPYVHDHLMLGWYLFGVLVTLLLVIDATLHRFFQRADNSNKSCENVRQDENPQPVICAEGKLKYMLVVFAGAILLSVGPAAAYKVNNQPHKGSLYVEIDLPESIAGWKNQVDIKDEWVPVYPGASSRKQVYQKYNDKITLYIGCYTEQQQGKELINDLNRISDEKIWRTVYPRARLSNTGGYQVLEQLLEANHDQQRLVWYWYRIADRRTTSEYEAKILQLLALLTGKHQACVMAVATDLKDDPEVARERLAEFVYDAGPVGISVVTDEF